MSNRQLELAGDRAINDFQSQTAEITGAPDPLLARLVIYVLALMVVTAIFLASVLKLERVVSGNGRIVSDVPSLLIQPLETSVVRAILVHAGQTVHKGDALATLDPTFSAADVGNLREQAERLKASIARLQAEQAGKPFIPAEDNPSMLLQKSIWNSRQAEYESRMLEFKQRIEGDEATIAHAREDVFHFSSRLDLGKEVEGMRKELERLQAGSKLNSLLAEDTRIEMSRNLAQAQNQILTATHEKQAQEAAREVYIQQWKSSITKELVDQQSEYQRISEELTKAERREDLVTLRAVEDAVVLEVGQVSVGSVVQPGEKLITLVPKDSQLFVEADLSAADQGFVAPGQSVNLKFAAYRYVDHGSAKGVVRSISADSFAPSDTKAQNPNRFYRARIDLTEVKLRNVPDDFALVPGMTVTSDIVVGRRTIISYLMGGAVRIWSDGMREP